jgi:hypothetical protein
LLQKFGTNLQREGSGSAFFQGSDPDPFFSKVGSRSDSKSSGSATLQIIFLLSDLFRIRSRVFRTKTDRTKVSFGYFLSSEQFRSENRAFGDRSFGERAFGGRAFGDLTMYREKAFGNYALKMR